MIENLKCPDCDGPMTPRTSQHGKFWGCKAYPKCRGTRNVAVEPPNRVYRPDESDEDRGLPSDRQRNNDRRRWE